MEKVATIKYKEIMNIQIVLSFWIYLNSLDKFLAIYATFKKKLRTQWNINEKII